MIKHAFQQGYQAKTYGRNAVSKEGVAPLAAKRTTRRKTSYTVHIRHRWLNRTVPL